jgi:hypothetical protein
MGLEVVMWKWSNPERKEDSILANGAQIVFDTRHSLDCWTFPVIVSYWVTYAEEPTCGKVKLHVLHVSCISPDQEKELGLLLHNSGKEEAKCPFVHFLLSLTTMQS